MQATVTSVAVYPLKSGYPIGEIRRIFMTANQGLSFDRRFMLVTADNRAMVTQRTPGMAGLATVGVDIWDDKVFTSFKDHTGKGPVGHFNAADVSDTPITVAVHGKPIDAFDAGDAVAQSFSDFFERPLRLMKLANNGARPVDPAYAGPHDRVGFADGFSVMLATGPSLRQVKEWSADDTITMRDFRPNIVIDGDFDAFAEDSWDTIRLGGTVLKLVKPCSRCVIPEIDQSTGIKRDNKQPTTALHAFRRAGKARYFGENAVVLQSGYVHKGDKLEVLSYRKAPHALLEGIAFTGFRP